MKIITAVLMSFALAAAADQPRRIVSLSPDLTEMIYAVGALNRVVGVSDYETYPPEAMQLPKLGGLLNPNLEKLMAMRPDLVILNDGQAPFLEEKLKDLGMHILRTSNKSLPQVYESISTIGKATGNEAQGGNRWWPSSTQPRAWNA